MKIKTFHIRLSQERLESDQTIINDFMNRVIVRKTVTELVNGPTNYWSILVFYDDQDSRNSKKLSVADFEELTKDEKNIFGYLKQWRNEKAIQLDIPPFMICHNSELMTIAKYKPQSLKELQEIKGFAEMKTANFGDDILALLNSI